MFQAERNRVPGATVCFTKVLKNSFGAHILHFYIVNFKHLDGVNTR